MKAAVSERDGDLNFLRSQLEGLTGQNNGLQVNRIEVCPSINSIFENQTPFLKSINWFLEFFQLMLTEAEDQVKKHCEYLHVANKKIEEIQAQFKSKEEEMIMTQVST